MIRGSLLRRWYDCRDGGRPILADAFFLGMMPRNWKLTDGQLIRLAYWGFSGEA